MDKIIVVNKEKDMTSRDVINELCKIFDTKKIGHTGTLDPLAEGVLVVCIGKSTKLVDELTSLDKEYVAEVVLGINTNTLDTTGDILDTKKTCISEKEIDDVLKTFIGKYHMQVPLYSSIKINGKKLYEYARNNIEIDLPYRDVEIFDIKRVSDVRYEDDKTIFKIKCHVSKGTYIRSLIRDIGLKFNTYGCMSMLTRTAQGKFKIEDSYKLSEIKNNNYKFVDIIDAIDLPKVELDDKLYKKVINGNKLENSFKFNKFCFIHNNELIAIYEIDEKDNNVVRPKKVFN